jgi:hypothetical protein
MQEIHKPGNRDVNRGGTISRSRKTLIFKQVYAGNTQTRTPGRKQRAGQYQGLAKYLFFSINIHVNNHFILAFHRI